MKIRVIIFDLGGVLIDFSHEKMCTQVSDYSEIKRTTIVELLFEKGVGEKIEKGEIKEEEFTALLQKYTPKILDQDLLMNAASDIFSPMPTVDLLPTLKKQGVKLLALSNTCAPHFNYLNENYSFMSLFDEVVLSHEVGVRKPHIGIYRHALSLADSKPEECFYTDDVIDYVTAAKEFGIDAHLFKSKEILCHTLSDRGYDCM